MPALLGAERGGGEGGGTRGGNFALGCVDDRVTATRRQYQRGSFSLSVYRITGAH